MLKTVLKGASVGLMFSGILFTIVRFLGFNSISLSIAMYMYVVLSIILFLKPEITGLLDQGILSRIVVVRKDEDLKMKKLTGETYRVREIEKL